MATIAERLDSIAIQTLEAKRALAKGDMSEVLDLLSDILNDANEAERQAEEALPAED